ncbi:O-antigen ligase family protein [Vibrio sp. S4M6]|uniref:O-antigen ligase family protein n=1 Tax=Vibrio sinus TaxID=2946865 RepID=UPI002029F86F|nr:O-antigen ligase [Vibrio sinus]MCL9780366.1 O-antigen ligase family protein [Vibrio sinus]
MGIKREPLPVKLVSIAIFLVPSLLLITKNFSVGVIVLTILFSFYFLFSYRKALAPLNKFDYLCLCVLSIYFLVNIPNTILDLGNLRYLKGGSRIILCIPIYFMMINILNRKSIDKIMDFLRVGVIVGSMGALAIALYQFYFLGEERVNGFLFSINFGYLSCSLAFLALCLSKDKNYRKLLVLAFLASCIACTLTLTRGAIFAIPLLLLTIALLRARELNALRTIGVALLFLAITISLVYTSPDLQKRYQFTVSELKDISQGNLNAAASTGGRLELWKASIEAFKRSPLFGLTYSQRDKLNKQLYDEGQVGKWVTTVQRGHAHNQYFEMLASNGILGVIGFIGMLFIPAMIFFSQYNKTKSMASYIGVIFVMGWIIFGITEVPLSANVISSFYGFILSIALAITRVEKYGCNNKILPKLQN